MAEIAFAKAMNIQHDLKGEDLPEALPVIECGALPMVWS